VKGLNLPKQFPGSISLGKQTGIQHIKVEKLRRWSYMQTIQDSAGSSGMWSTSAGGHLMKVVNLTSFTVYRSYGVC